MSGGESLAPLPVRSPLFKTTNEKHIMKHDLTTYDYECREGAADRFFDAIEAGKSINEAAAIAGISQQMLQELAEDPVFGDAVDFALLASGHIPGDSDE
jgi:hypothetical protein